MMSNFKSYFRNGLFPLSFLVHSILTLLFFCTNFGLISRVDAQDARQGKYWEYSKLVFANQDNLEEDELRHYARNLDLDMKRFPTDLQDPALLFFLKRDINHAKRLKVNGTPTFFINSKKVVGNQSFNKLKLIIDLELETISKPNTHILSEVRGSSAHANLEAKTDAFKNASTFPSSTCGRPYYYSYEIGSSGESCSCTMNMRTWGACGGPPPEIPSAGIWPGCIESMTMHHGVCPALCKSYTDYPTSYCGSSSWDLTCSADVCDPSPEVCDGEDNDGNGQIDEGVCEPDNNCQNFRTDPVHVGTGGFLTHPKVDVRFEGTAVPMEFVRRYTSMDAWPIADPTRLGVGWFHTYDERLYGPDARSDANPWAVSLSEPYVVHRTATGRARRFTCAAPNAFGTFSCTTVDGSLHKLSWVRIFWGIYRWQLRAPNGVTTYFSADGRLLGKRNTRGQGWTVHYHSGGTLDRYIDYVEDHLGRRLTFEWMSPTSSLSARPLLMGLGVGRSFAFFEYVQGRAFLRSARSAAGDEEYEYLEEIASGTPFVRPFLAAINRDGQAAVTVRYNANTGKVAEIVAADGSYALRYAGSGRNICPFSTESTLIVDRSTDPVPRRSCTDDAVGDAFCQAEAGGLAVCDGGTCRAATCQRYDLNPRDRISASRPVEVSGNCPCGGTQSIGWTTGGTESPPQVAWTIDRSGTRTTYAYDTRGRMVARCEGDDDTAVTTVPTSCPTSGVWTSWEYDNTWITFQRFERRRSRLDSTALYEIEYVYDSTHPELLAAHERGKTLALYDTIVPETLSSSYNYDSLGRLLSITEPGGERTTFRYHPLGVGHSSGLLQARREHVDTRVLATTYSNYQSVGRPGTVVRPWKSAEHFSYEYGGMRLRAHRVDGRRSMEFLYHPSGRIREIVEPSGRRRVYNYNSLGRLTVQDIHDSPRPGADRVQYRYDDAGRLTSTAFLRLDASGTPGSSFHWIGQTKYDQQGYPKTRDFGSRAHLSFVYDRNGLGWLEQVERSDGDRMTMAYDSLGRRTEFRRHIGAGSGAYQLSYNQPSNATSPDVLPTQVVDPNGVQRRYVYDDFGNLVRSESPDYGTHRWRYQRGRLVEELRPTGKRTVYSYDALGRVTLINHNADRPSELGQDYRFVYDNGDGRVACNIAYDGVRTACKYRTGRLARVEIEYSPGSFWELEYDYGPSGEITAERWPNRRQTTYEYDATGLLVRMQYPVQTGDMLRFEYDTVPGNGLDQSEVVTIVGERKKPDTNYIRWTRRKMARDALGRLRAAFLADEWSGTGSAVSVAIGYNKDGSVGLWRVQRSTTGRPEWVISRVYQYWPDGMVRGYRSEIPTTDPSRSFFYDQGNRLTCATTTEPGITTSCPAGGDPTLVATYTYDMGDNRRTMRDASGERSYLLSGNTLTGENLTGGRAISYNYNRDGTREWEEERTTGTPTNRRTYTYDGLGRLSGVLLPRPGTTAGNYENHRITILYDHRSRPIHITDQNIVTGQERREQFYWDIGDYLINRVVTPNLSTPATYSVDVYANIERVAVGSIRLNYASGRPKPSERYFYTVLDPVGLPVAVYEFERSGPRTSEVWRAQYSPFGEVLAASGDNQLAPPWRFIGQVVLTGSQVEVWNGTVTREIRSPLYLNSWRVYDPRVGQYLSPEPFAVRGIPSFHPYAYAANAPYDYIDPLGLWVVAVPLPQLIPNGEVSGGAFAWGGEVSGNFVFDDNGNIGYAISLGYRPELGVNMGSASVEFFWFPYMDTIFELEGIYGGSGIDVGACSIGALVSGGTLGLDISGGVGVAVGWYFELGHTWVIPISGTPSQRPDARPSGPGGGGPSSPGGGMDAGIPSAADAGVPPVPVPPGPPATEPTGTPWCESPVCSSY